MDFKDRHNYSITLGARTGITICKIGRNGRWIGAKVSFGLLVFYFLISMVTMLYIYILPTSLYVLSFNYKKPKNELV